MNNGNDTDCNGDSTHIRVSKITKEKLDGVKIHPRETYDDQINRYLLAREAVHKIVRKIENDTELKKHISTCPFYETLRKHLDKLNKMERKI